MTISSLLITLSDDEHARAAALTELSRDARLTLGQVVAGRLPLVLESESAKDGERIAESLLEVPGVCFVDLVGVVFEEEL